MLPCMRIFHFFRAAFLINQSSVFILFKNLENQLKEFYVELQADNTAILVFFFRNGIYLFVLYWTWRSIACCCRFASFILCGKLLATLDLFNLSSPPTGSENVCTNFSSAQYLSGKKNEFQLFKMWMFPSFLCLLLRLTSILEDWEHFRELPRTQGNTAYSFHRFLNF